MAKIHAFIINKNESTVEDLMNTFNSVLDCNAISVLSYKLVEGFEYFITTSNRGFHLLTPETTIEKEINDLVKKVESDYYIVLNAGSIVENIKEKIEKYTQEDEAVGMKRKLAMVKSKYELDGLLVHSLTHLAFLGFGEQTIMEKIEICAKNNNEEHFILESLDELNTK